MKSAAAHEIPAGRAAVVVFVSDEVHQGALLQALQVAVAAAAVRSGGSFAPGFAQFIAFPPGVVESSGLRAVCEPVASGCAERGAVSALVVGEDEGDGNARPH